jgi:hypothetical protein
MGTTHLLYLHDFRVARPPKTRLTSAAVAERFPRIEWLCPNLLAAPKLAMQKCYRPRQIGFWTLRQSLVRRWVAAPGFGYDLVDVNAVPRLSFAQVHETYEHVMGLALDKSAFRRKLTEMDVLEECKGQRVGGAHRPAQLFKVKADVANRLRLLERPLGTPALN